MANSTVQAVSPRITVALDLDEAKALKKALEKIQEDHERNQDSPWTLESVYEAVRHGVADAEKITKGVGYVG